LFVFTPLRTHVFLALASIFPPLRESAFLPLSRGHPPPRDDSLAPFLPPPTGESVQPYIILPTCFSFFRASPLLFLYSTLLLVPLYKLLYTGAFLYPPPPTPPTKHNQPPKTPPPHTHCGSLFFLSGPTCSFALSLWFQTCLRGWLSFSVLSYNRSATIFYITRPILLHGFGRHTMFLNLAVVFLPSLHATPFFVARHLLSFC